MLRRPSWEPTYSHLRGMIFQFEMNAAGAVILPALLRDRPRFRIDPKPIWRQFPHSTALKRAFVARRRRGPRSRGGSSAPGPGINAKGRFYEAVYRPFW